MKRLCLIVFAFLPLALCGCTKEPMWEPPAQENPVQVETVENPALEEPIPEEPTPEETELEEATQEAPGQAEWRIDANTLTDAKLLEIIVGGEIALTGDNSFTFSEPTELSSQELYLLFLMFSDYDTLANDCLDEERGEFTFTESYISAQLSRYFKDFTLDIAQINHYDAEKDAVVTKQASGFGGDRFVNIVEK